MTRIAAAVFDFAGPRARRNAFFVLLLAAFLSPNIDMPAGLPAIRIEQVLLAAVLPSLAFFVRDHPWARRLTLVDVAFVALAACTAATIALGPVIVSEAARSVRDVFELARLAEYWLLYRLGLTVVHEAHGERMMVMALVGAAVVSGLFALAQYFGGKGFNEQVAGIWAVNHNLDALVRTGRTVGTVGNPNMFGILTSLFLVAALAFLLLRAPGPAMRWWLVAAVAAATLGVVLSQSRTAVFALLGAMVVALAAVAWVRRRQAAYGLALASFFVSAAGAVAFVELVPPETGTFHQRFSPTGFSSDASLNLRFDKWKALFAGFFEEQPDFCAGDAPGEGPIGDGNNPQDRTTGAPPAGLDATARDGQRKEDVVRISRAVVDYFCEHEAWPANRPLVDALVPEFLDALPADPADGSAYPATVTTAGYTVGARLEDPSDPFGPVYTVGTIPSIVLNPSFEGGDGTPGRWTADRSASVSRAEEAALFGDYGARVTYGGDGNFFHVIVFDFAPEERYTVSAWVRAPDAGAPVQDSTLPNPGQAQLYLVATFPSGIVEDPYASQTFNLPADGSWTQVALTIETDDADRIATLQVIVRAPGAPDGTVLDVDGVTLALGDLPLSFPRARSVDPATLRSLNLPDFADSPLIGVGPRNNLNLSAVDNEYALFLDQYGITGTLAYLALWGTAAWLAIEAWRRGTGVSAALALGFATFTLALVVFNIAAGSYYNFQVMAIYWLIGGYVAGVHIQRTVRRDD